MEYYPIMNGNTWEWGTLMMFLWFIFFLVVVFLLVRVFRSNITTTKKDEVDPMDIAKERYAKGEITKEQFDQLRKDLK